MQRSPSLASLVLLGLSLCASAQGNVHVVDASGGGGSDFVSLAAAVAAAAPGDVLLVRSGDYAQAIALDAKPLVIVAEVGADVRALGADVRHTAAGQPVAIRGLTLSTTDDVSATIEAALGPVWLEDTTFLGVPVPPDPLSASGGLTVADSAAAVVSRCTVTRPFLTAPVGALHATGSRVHVFDGSITSQPGQAAVALTSSFLDVAGSFLTGIDGGDGVGFPFCTAQPGGNGLVLSGASQALVRGTVLVGGAGGAPCGADGQPLIVNGGAATVLPGAVGSYRIDSLARDDETVRATFRADPGDRAWLLFSTSPAPGVAAGVFDGELVLSLAALDGVFAGVVPASGELELRVPAPALGAGAESLVLFTQALLQTPGQRLRVATPSMLVVVDDAL